MPLWRLWVYFFQYYSPNEGWNIQITPHCLTPFIYTVPKQAPPLRVSVDVEGKPSSLSALFPFFFLYNLYHFLICQRKSVLIFSGMNGSVHCTGLCVRVCVCGSWCCFWWWYFRWSCLLHRWLENLIKSCIHASPATLSVWVLPWTYSYRLYLKIFSLLLITKTV